MNQSHNLFSNCPWESGGIVPHFDKIPDNYSEQISTKANPPMVMFADETSRGAINKATMPFFMIKPPFGVTRFKDLPTLRRLGNTPQARMAKQTIIDEVVAIPWAIIPAEETDEIDQATQNKIDEVTNFFMNPNTNDENLGYLIRQMMEDLLDWDSGIWVKEFDESGRMVELRAFDGSTFLKNPNIFGKYDNRADIIPIGTIILDQDTSKQLFPDIGREINSERAAAAALTFGAQPGITPKEARDQAAYFQYPFSSGFSFTSGVRPIAFGRREIIWFEANPQTSHIYGRSPTESILEVLQTLKYSIEYNLDYFEDNNVPKGFISLTGANQEEMEAFRDNWNELQLKTNAEGLIKKNFHRVPITNVENANFIRVQFSAAELQLIESQKWFSELVWASYGVTPSELGFTENSNLATEINQSRVFKRKAILPKLKLIEDYINKEVVTEWDFNEDIKFKFNTFDVEDEKNKWELYKVQIETGAKTINEIRKLEGLEELDEEDLPQKVGAEDVEDMRDEANKPKDPKPEDSKENAEKKAIETTLETINQRMDKIINRDKTALLKEMRKNSVGRLTQIKDFNTIINALSGILNFSGLKAGIAASTLFLFTKGLKETEEMAQKSGINVNAVSTSPEKIEFLSDMAFENIKNLSDEMKSKLKQQLKIGVSSGEGIGQLSDRVQRVFEATKNRAEMISRTESNRIENQGSLHAAQQIQADGVQIKKYLLWTLDARTSELTKALHAKYGSRELAIPLNENFKLNWKGREINQSLPPFHPNERDQLITFVIGK